MKIQHDALDMPSMAHDSNITIAHEEGGYLWCWLLANVVINASKDCFLLEGRTMSLVIKIEHDALVDKNKNA